MLSSKSAVHTSSTRLEVRAECSGVDTSFVIRDELSSFGYAASTFSNLVSHKLEF